VECGYDGRCNRYDGFIKSTTLRKTNYMWENYQMKQHSYMGSVVWKIFRPVGREGTHAIRVISYCAFELIVWSRNQWTVHFTPAVISPTNRWTASLKRVYASRVGPLINPELRFATSAVWPVVISSHDSVVLFPVLEWHVWVTHWSNEYSYAVSIRKFSYS
jgi:hypothetical protein